MCDRMMRKGQRKSAALYLAAAVLMTCCLTQTIDCYRLRKKERREGREESDLTKVPDVQEGRIIFGSVFKKATGVNAPVSGETKKPSNASSEDDASYQADSPGWSGGDVQHRSSREAAWKRMSPSLLCGGDQLKFNAEGLGASQFAVEKGNEPAIPLSQVPQSCGYGMQKNSLGLILLVPYDGCNMVVEDGHYVLPLRWHGIPVSLLCHKLASPSTAAPEKPQPPTPWNSPSYPLVPLPNRQNPQMPPPNGQKPQPHVIYPQFYPQIPTPDVMYPQMQPPHVRHPQMVLPHLIYPQMLPEGMPPLTQEDVPQTPLKLGLDMPLMEDDVPLVPLEIPRMHSDQYGLPPKIPQSYFFLPYANYPSVPEPSKAPIATTAEKPEMPKLPLYPPFYHPYYSNFPHPVSVTSAPTATAKPAPKAPQIFPFPMHPSFPWSGLPLQPTTNPTLPATRPQPQYFPFPHSYEYSAPKPETTTTKPQFAYMPFPSPYQSFPPRMVRPHPATMIKN
ncbi:uncharacterized protein LOC134105260 [Pungitius pungitius]|uniref:uncharacterized protein LOC134105260 n=1 Tax=Pungitius pungitius TaxID=134920 RepID=UPI002E0EACA1